MIAATLNTFQQSSYGTFTTIPKGSQISSLQSYGFQVSACWIHPKPWHKTGTRNQVSPTTWTHNFISTMKSFSFGITLGKTSCPCSDITPIFSLAILLCSSSCPTEPQTKSLPINLWVPRTTTIVLEATVLVSAIPCNLLRIHGVRTCLLCGVSQDSYLRDLATSLYNFDTRVSIAAYGTCTLCWSTNRWLSFFLLNDFKSLYGVKKYKSIFSLPVGAESFPVSELCNVFHDTITLRNVFVESAFWKERSSCAVGPHFQMTGDQVRTWLCTLKWLGVTVVSSLGGKLDGSWMVTFSN